MKGAKQLLRRLAGRGGSAMGLLLGADGCRYVLPGGDQPVFCEPSILWRRRDDKRIILAERSIGDVAEGTFICRHAERYERTPDAMLVDGGFAKKEDIDTVSSPEVGVVVYAPVQKPKKADRDPHTPRAGDSVAVAAWRVRMGTDEAKAIYKERASTAECVNAIARNRGLRQFLVRGLAKVRAVVLWFALAHNLMRAVALRAAGAAGAG